MACCTKTFTTVTKTYSGARTFVDWHWEIYRALPLDWQEINDIQQLCQAGLGNLPSRWCMGSKCGPKQDTDTSIFSCPDKQSSTLGMSGVLEFSLVRYIQQYHLASVVGTLVLHFELFWNHRPIGTRPILMIIRHMIRVLFSSQQYYKPSTLSK